MKRNDKLNRRVGAKNLQNGLKEIIANSKSLREWTEEKCVDDKGRAVIKVFVDESSLYNPLSDPKDPIISDEVVTHIEKEEYIIPVEYPLIIRFISKEPLSKQEEIQKKIKEHFYLALSDSHDDRQKNTTIWILLLSLGVILYSLYFVFSYVFSDAYLFNEIFSVGATFTVWEAFDYLLIQANAIKIKELNNAQLALAQIEFEVREN